MPLRAVASLRTKVLVLLALALAPAVVLSVADAEAQRGEAIAQVHAHTIQLAQLTAVAQTRTFETSEQTLAGLAWVVYLDPRQQELCRLAVQRARESSPLFQGLGIITPDGWVRCSTNFVPGRLSLANTTTFQRAMATGRFAVGDYRITRVTGEPTVGVMLPVLNETGAVQGLVSATLDLQVLSARLAVDFPPGYVLAVWDRQGTIIARQPEPEDWIGESYGPADQAELLAAQNQTVERAGVDGVLRVYATVPLGEGPAAFLAVGAPVAAALAPIEASFARDLLVLAAVGVLAFGLAWVASDRWLLRPLEALASASRRLAGGDLRARTGLVHGAGEVGHVAQAFDDMADSLSQALEREHRARAELEAANARLGELDTFRRDFVNQAAHELNNPLTSITLQTELLRTGTAGPLSPRQRQCLQIIERNVGRLARLAQDVLDAARVQADRLAVEPERLDLAKLVREAAEAHRERAAASGVALGAEPGPPVTVEADPQRLAQVLDNLVANALKFTPRGGSVLLAAAREGGRAVVRVRDTGVGFPPEDAARLFQPFSQLPAGRMAGGTGLGLYVCRGIVEQHGGTIAAASDGPGRGATFTFGLPLAPTVAEPDPPEGAGWAAQPAW